jgi:hypothetical protein
MFYFRKHKVNQFVYDTGYSEVKVNYQMNIPINKLKTNIKLEKKLIKKNLIDTPHYQEVASLSENGKSSQVYETYIETYFTNGIEEKDRQKNIKLINDYKKGADFILLVRPKISLYSLLNLKFEYVIMDGAHRAAVLRYFDAKYVECAIYLYN